jgi:hypothetical protein
MITRRQVIRYSVLPGFKPRLKELFASGFHYIPFLIALVYQSVRLLPANHPYCIPANLGKFGIRHVIAEAANNLVINRKNIDQLLLFLMILFGLALIFIQFALLGISFVTQPALAQALPDSFSGFFMTPIDPGTGYPSQDLALIFLDMVFGIPDLFNSCVSTGHTCFDTNGNEVVNSSDQWILTALEFPFPIHLGLHQLFQFYSMGLMVVAFFITLYFLITIVAETAQAGTPFGKRFNKVWAPLRIVMAFGLLVPVGYGLNSAQYIVLYAAKFGSGFATNGWNLFNESLDAAAVEQMSAIGSTSNLVSKPNVPEVGTFLQFMYAARTCAELVQIKEANGEGDPLIEAYLVKDPVAVPNSLKITPYGPGAPLATTYADLINFLQGAKQAIIVFGKRSPQDYPSERGNVKPVCGELILPLTDPRMPGSENPPEPGSEIMQSYYWFILQELWFHTFQGRIPVDTPELAVFNNPTLFNFPKNTAILNTPFKKDPAAAEPPPDYKAAIQSFYSGDLNAAMLDPPRNSLQAYIGEIGAIPAQANAGRWFAQESPTNPDVTVLQEKGWAGAGIWYNKVAELNGAISASVLNIPMPSLYPDAMEEIKLKKQVHNVQTTLETIFSIEVAGGEGIGNDLSPDAQDYAKALNAAYDFWASGGQTSTSHTAASGNAFYDMINALLGTSGLYSMRRNADVHPLAQLVGVGRSLVESAIRNIGYATIGGVGGGLFKMLSINTGEAANMIIGFFMTLAMISLTAGFILFYVVPFLPFIYFFFAVGGWVKGIFEAMVGAPLWALAHIRIDGNGLSGQAAVGGYFLIFEIFIRPILIVFGLLASISIFAALVNVMNQTWDLVVSNVGGFDVEAEIAAQKGEPIDTNQGPQETFSLMDTLRNPIDEFFYTVVYAVVCYLMAMSSFKLIDLIPNNILRWMGQSIATFNDQREDPAQGMVGTATIGAQQTIGETGKGYQGLLKTIAQG